MSREPSSSLFLIQYGSNVGYAISPLETLFYESGLEIGGQDPRRVHFGYANLERGHPRSLPDDFANVSAFDFRDGSYDNVERLAAYVERHAIRLVLIFDVQPTHPLFKRLRQAGATTILTYWGAPISSRMPAWKLALRRIELAISRSKVDGLIFESRAMADLAIYGRGVPKHMLDVVPLGVDTCRFRPERTNYAHQALLIDPRQNIVIYAGHMEQRKGVGTLIEAAVELLSRRHRSDICFLICGNRGDQSKTFERMYAGLGIDEGIRFAGYRNDMAQLYTSCFCGVIASTGWDSFPRTSLEMAAAGLPVLASRLQGLPEAVLDRQTGLLFEPGNAQALADLIEMLIDKPDLAAKYGRLGRERCEREYTLDVQRQRFLAALRRRLDN